ncbi:MAG: fumarylacetoacetase [Gemmatimonadaceae bacterium]
MIDSTHDPDLTSWVESANDSSTDFPIQNLPLGVFRPQTAASWRVGVAIGSMVLDLAELADRGLMPTPLNGIETAARQSSLNALLALGPAVRRGLRSALSVCLRSDLPEGRAVMQHAVHLLHPADSVELRVPVDVGDYTDFYASIHHATNIGRMLRPDQPLLPNYQWIPIGYHGRASSLVISGSSVRRPCGQTKGEGASAPTFTPSARLDYEAELAFVIGSASSLGSRVPIAEAGAHIAGVLLLNDWSARDIQAWEYQPLGPFLSKNFATTLSPWLVTTEALAPFRAAALQRSSEDPAPLPYLFSAEDQQSGAIDVRVGVSLRSAEMRRSNQAPAPVSLATAADMYWTPAQLLAHHTSNGCSVRVGDVLGSGTISGTTRESRGCLMELTWRGTEPITLPTGEIRRFLEDGDEVRIHGYCERPGFRRIGLGFCVGVVDAALPGA